MVLMQLKDGQKRLGNLCGRGEACITDARVGSKRLAAEIQLGEGLGHADAEWTGRTRDSDLALGHTWEAVKPMSAARLMSLANPCS